MHSKGSTDMANVVELPIKLLDESLEMPTYAYPGDAGLDLRSAESFILKPFERKTVPCGIALAIPQGFAGLVIPRSGLASKHGISIVNAPGLIDANYRGEIKVVLINLDSEATFAVQRGDRIAQLVFAPVARVAWDETDALDETERGEGGFGSTGQG